MKPALALRATAALIAVAAGAPDASAEPYRLRGEAIATARAPAGLVVLDAGGGILDPISAEALVWAGRDEIGTDADALVISIRFRDPKHRAEAKLGRFVLVPGALRPLHLDGADALVRLPWKGTFEVFGGVPVVPRFGSRPFAWTVGGRAAQRFGDVGAVGIAYLHRRDAGRLADQEVGLDLSLAPLDGFDLAARGSYDLTNDPGPSEVVIIAGASSGAWRAELAGTHRSPGRILPATSLFSVLGDAASNHGAARVTWRAAPRLDLRAEGGARLWDGVWGEDVEVRALLRLDDPGDRWVALELRRQGGPDLAWSGARASGRAPIALGLALSLELELAIPDDADRGALWPWGLGALSWAYEGWEVAAGVEAGASPEHEYRVDALVRLAYAWSAR